MVMAGTAGGSTGESARTRKAGQVSVSESQLLDVLYEILAQGGDPSGQLTGAEVEVFLCEHARAPKSQGEMLAFFERHNLSTDPAVYGADPELGEIASGLHRERGPASSVFPLDDEAPAPEEPVTGARAMPRAPVAEAASSAVSTSTTQVVAGASSLWLRVAVAALGICLVAGATLSYTRAKDLEEQLAQARLQQHSTDSALTALEQRAGQLQTALGESETGRRTLDATVKTYMTEQATQRAAEQAALQKLLGPRYGTLTQQALTTTP